MDRVLALLPLAACAGGMALCMWLMTRGTHHGPSDASPTGQQASAREAAMRQELIELREQVQHLQAERQHPSDDRSP